MISAAFVETRVHASCILLAAGSATKYPGAAVILNKKQSKFNWNVSRYFRSWCRSYYAILTTLCIIRARVPTSLSLSVSSYSRKRLSSILHGGAMSSALSSAPCRRGCLSDALLSNHFIVAGYAPTHTDLAFRFLRFRRGLSAILFGRATLCP